MPPASRRHPPIAFRGLIMPNPREAIEARIGIQGIEELHDQRRTLVSVASGLRALHGPFGSGEVRRKIILSGIRDKIRTQHQVSGTKVTEAALDDKAHASTEYVAYVEDMIRQREQLVLVDNSLLEINDLITRDNTLVYHLTAEVKLQ